MHLYHSLDVLSPGDGCLSWKWWFVMCSLAADALVDASHMVHQTQFGVDHPRGMLNLSLENVWSSGLEISEIAVDIAVDSRNTCASYESAEIDVDLHDGCSSLAWDGRGPAQPTYLPVDAPFAGRGCRRRSRGLVAAPPYIVTVADNRGWLVSLPTWPMMAGPVSANSAFYGLSVQCRVDGRRSQRPCGTRGWRPALQMHPTGEAPLARSGCWWRNRGCVVQPRSRLALTTGGSASVALTTWAYASRDTARASPHCRNRTLANRHLLAGVATRAIRDPIGNYGTSSPRSDELRSPHATDCTTDCRSLRPCGTWGWSPTLQMHPVGEALLAGSG